jgi:hypothetical protein
MPPSRPLPDATRCPTQNDKGAALPAGHGFLAGAAVVIVERAAAAGFFLLDFGFLTSRLLRFCPLAMSLLLSLEHCRL